MKLFRSNVEAENAAAVGNRAEPRELTGACAAPPEAAVREWL